MERNSHDGELDSVGNHKPIEIHRESPLFILHNGRGRLELLTSTTNGVLRFTTIMLTADGRLLMTNETESRSLEIRHNRMQIGRNFPDGFFNGYVGRGHGEGGYLSGNHCELVVHARGVIDSTTEMGVEISVKNANPPPPNRTYYIYNPQTND